VQRQVHEQVDDPTVIVTKVGHKRRSRSTLLWKCAGLTGEQLALASVPPSNLLPLLGIVRHMADMERAWFRIRFRGEALPRLYQYEDAALEHADPARVEADFAALHRGMRPGPQGGGPGVPGR
jgi:hypothetical protein